MRIEPSDLLSRAPAAREARARNAHPEPPRATPAMPGGPDGPATPAVPAKKDFEQLSSELEVLLIRKIDFLTGRGPAGYAAPAPDPGVDIEA